MNNAYSKAGVDVEAGYQAVDLMKEHIKKTHIPGVISDIGGFGGLFELGKGYQNPVLVSGTDGVGTKLKIAFLMDKHDTVGQDCVAMCVNDIACSGAKPLFFLDYIAVGKNIPQKVATIVKGVADGCVQAGCALIGGETAEMPGFYPEDEYDLAGFSVGIVDKEKIINTSKISEGDVLIGIASSGIHSNGYSLVRRVFNLNSKNAAENLNIYISELSQTLGEELLKPTTIYVKTILDLCSQFDISGISHITGGGFYENIPRMLKKGLTARISDTESFVLPIFKLIEKSYDITKKELFNTFNMGIGLVLAVKSTDCDAVVAKISTLGQKAYVIGEVVKGDEGILAQGI